MLNEFESDMPNEHSISENLSSDDTVGDQLQSTSKQIRSIESEPNHFPVFIYATTTPDQTKVIHVTFEDGEEGELDDFQLIIKGGPTNEESKALDALLPLEEKLKAIEPQNQKDSYNPDFGLEGEWKNWGGPFMDNRYDFFGKSTLKLNPDFSIPEILQPYLEFDHVKNGQYIDMEFLESSIELRKMDDE